VGSKLTVQNNDADQVLNDDVSAQIDDNADQTEMIDNSNPVENHADPAQMIGNADPAQMIPVVDLNLIV